MKPLGPALAGLLSLAAMTGAWADEAGLRLGHAIFTGALDSLSAAERAALPARQLGRFPCAGCHGRDGAGGTEGEAPPIRWPALAAPSVLRTRYDGPGFHAAVTTGRDPEGRTLTRLMPRYALDPAATAALRGYLAALPALDRRGVTPTALEFCVVIRPEAAAPLRAYAARLATALTDLAGDAGLYGRHPKVIPLEGPPDQVLAAAEDRCLAVIGLVPDNRLPISAFSDLGVPVLFPLAQLSGREDRTIVRALRPTRRDVFAALVRDLGAQGVTSVHIVGDDGDAGDLLQMLRLDPATTHAEATHGADVALPDDVALVALGPLSAETLMSLKPGRRLWVLSQSAMAEMLPAGVDATVMIDAPGLVSFALGAGLDPQEAHATLTAEVLVAALKGAGREVGRAGLLRGFGDAVLGHVGLDYDDVPLTGTKDVLPLRPGAGE